MVRCPNCGQEVPAGARYCPACGEALTPRQPSPQQQPPLPFSPWGPPKMASQPAGAGAVAAQPEVGSPLSIKQVAIAVAAILLFLALIVIIGRGGFGGKTTDTVDSGAKSLPVIGIVGEAVNLGNTSWGVAFTDETSRIDNQPPQHGQFYAVGIVIGNKSEASIALSRGSVGLIDEESGKRYTPRMTAWGTPDDISAGRYTTEYSLPARQAIAGLVIFDVPRDMGKPRLLVRDLTTDNREFTAEIDLTKQKPSDSESSHLAPWRIRNVDYFSI